MPTVVGTNYAQLSILSTNVGQHPLAKSRVGRCDGQQPRRETSRRPGRQAPGARDRRAPVRGHPPGHPRRRPGGVRRAGIRADHHPRGRRAGRGRRLDGHALLRIQGRVVHGRRHHGPAHPRPALGAGQRPGRTAGAPLRHPLGGSAPRRRDDRHARGPASPARPSPSSSSPSSASWSPSRSPPSATSGRPSAARSSRRSCSAWACAGTSCASSRWPRCRPMTSWPPSGRRFSAT